MKNNCANTENIENKNVNIVKNLTSIKLKRPFTDGCSTVTNALTPPNMDG